MLSEIQNIFKKLHTTDKTNQHDMRGNKNIYVFSLGNPGDKYKHTRHNAGRLVCEELVHENFFTMKSSELMLANGSQIRYSEPDTYMNETGKYIREKMRHAKSGSLVVIVYDDIDLPLGEVKLSYGRSSGGHNGVESVIAELGTRDFYRVRVGIGGKPIKEMLLQDYVLSRLKEDEIKLIRDSSVKVKDKLSEIISQKA